jgi:hypothetical protein
MELKPNLQRLFVADRHRHPVDFRMDMESFRRAARAERMISPDMDRLADAIEGTGAVMVEPAGLPMNRRRCPFYPATGLKDDRLVPKADAKQRNPARGE